MFYYTYVLKSLKTDKQYTGFCENLKSRIKEHNAGRVEATKNGMPWTLVYYEACLSKESAIKREKQLKTGFGRAYLKRRLTDSRKEPE